jgi:hypothetical protein
MAHRTGIKCSEERQNRKKSRNREIRQGREKMWDTEERWDRLNTESAHSRVALRLYLRRFHCVLGRRLHRSGMELKGSRSQGTRDKGEEGEGVCGNGSTILRYTVCMSAIVIDTPKDAGCSCRLRRSRSFAICKIQQFLFDIPNMLSDFSGLPCVRGQASFSCVSLSQARRSKPQEQRMMRWEHSSRS